MKRGKGGGNSGQCCWITVVGLTRRVKTWDFFEGGETQQRRLVKNERKGEEEKEGVGGVVGKEGLAREGNSISKRNKASKN